MIIDVCHLRQPDEVDVAESDLGDDEATAPHTPSLRAGLTALGVVYGDIGTSPLYALKSAVTAAQGGGGTQSEAVIGAVSLIIWALVLIVAVKYASLILRADNRGEGGIVALLALLKAREAPPRSWRAGLLVLGLVGAALLYGDGAITPAISVLSAVEGLKLDAPVLTSAVIPITMAVLVSLFFVQRKGTGFIGGIFGPVMLVWFVAIGVLGLRGIAFQPAVLAALNPLRAAAFLVHAPLAVSFAVLGAAFLAVTGGEAMYADMGHFGRNPIRLAWFAVVLPCLLLNYLGQGGLLLAQPSALDNPFYQLAPAWAHYPLVAFATAATIIASQAIISGAFSLTQQSILLGFLPRMHVVYTGKHEAGQIYIPLVNWCLAIATLGAVISFGSSDALAGAYGIAVSALMGITTVLAALVALQWGFNPALVLAVNGSFLLVDLVFFAANSIKLLEGGWFPLVLAFGVAFIMMTWRKGTQLVETIRGGMRDAEENFLSRLAAKPPTTLSGTAIFLTAATSGIPLPMTHFLRHTRAMYSRVLLVTVESAQVPVVSPERRFRTMPVANGISRLVLRFGFTERPNVPAAIQDAVTAGVVEPLDAVETTYVIGRETVIPVESVHGMSHWREVLFAFIQRNSERSAAYFEVPSLQVIEMGTELEI